VGVDGDLVVADAGPLHEVVEVEASGRAVA
jgi:hypothetical protein